MRKQLKATQKQIKLVEIINRGAVVTGKGDMGQTYRNICDIITPTRALVGIAQGAGSRTKLYYIRLGLLGVTSQKQGAFIEFESYLGLDVYSPLNNTRWRNKVEYQDPTQKECQECAEYSLKYLNAFIGNDILCNFEERKITLKPGYGVRDVAGLYTLDGGRVPRIIPNKSAGITNLGKEHMLEESDFWFTKPYLDWEIEDVPQIKFDEECQIRTMEQDRRGKS